MTAAEVFDLAVGALLGTAVAFNLSRFGLSLRDPATRWKALGVLAGFLLTFLILTDLVRNGFR